MDQIRIVGKNRINGSIPISGAKNAALPLMIASLLSDETLTLENVPRLADVRLLAHILENHGVDMTINGRRAGQARTCGQTLNLRARDIVDCTAPYELVSKMRASFWVIGPLLARGGQARVSLPGGCAIGTRPVDLFLEGLRALGAEISIDDGYVNAQATGGLVGNHIAMRKCSVGATHTIMMAATLAKGRTVIANAAREPEVITVAQCLNKMGAKIHGIGTKTLTIDGVDRLHGTEHRVLPDRIETGTYAMAVAMTGGDVLLEGAESGLLDAAIAVLEEAGITIDTTNQGLHVARNGSSLKPVTVDTQPYPGFPTDLQAQLMALMSMADGTSTITETIFENRFMHVQELARLGADIQLDGQTAYVKGVDNLYGAPVMATDLRASVSLVIAGLAAKGETVINRVYHLDRGFEGLEEKLRACGAEVERVSV